MRIQLKLIEQDSTVNHLKYISSIDVRRGETLEVIVQLVQENGIRYIPEHGCTVEVEIARNKVAIGVTGRNERDTFDPSIKREAVPAFAGDRSFWKIPITIAETKYLASGAVKVTLTEGDKVRISQYNQAIRIIDGQER
jgi:hypothetical protein